MQYLPLSRWLAIASLLVATVALADPKNVRRPPPAPAPVADDVDDEPASDGNGDGPLTSTEEDAVVVHFWLEPHRLGKDFIKTARDKLNATPGAGLPASLECPIGAALLCDHAHAWKGEVNDCIDAGTSKAKCITAYLGQLFGSERYIDTAIMREGETCLANAMRKAWCAPSSSGPEARRTDPKSRAGGCSRAADSVSINIGSKIPKAVQKSTAAATDKNVKEVCRAYFASLTFERTGSSGGGGGGGGGGGDSTPSAPSAPVDNRTPTRRCWDACDKDRRACRASSHDCFDQEKACKNRC